jgi:ribonuclease HI
MKQINIYTDGACSGNQNDTNIGGWGCILEYGEHRKELCGGELDTTNNRMELLALITAIGALKEPGLSIRVFSDSAYLVDCFRKKWYENWQRNGWKTSAKKPVENQDLWMTLLRETAPHQVRFYRIKGHLNLKAPEKTLEAAYQDFVKGNGFFTRDEFLYIAQQNIRADELANEFIRAHRQTVAGTAAGVTDPRKRPPAILFDLDGTLWDSAKQVAESWNIALEDYPDITFRFTTKKVRQSMGRVLEEIAGMWFPEMDPERREVLMRHASDVELEYLKTHPGKLFPAARKTLAELSKSCELYIVSNCQLGYIEGFFEGTGLRKYFIDYECAGRTGKPKAGNIRLVMERNGLDRCLYVGDTQKDCDAADGAGIPFVHAAFGFGQIDRPVPRLEAFGDLPEFAAAFFGTGAGS